MSQLNLHRGPSVEELSPLWQGWSLTLTHPQKLFDINCRSHIISCHSLSGIYGWSHWLGAEPSIKLLRRLTLSPLHRGPIFPECRLNMQIHSGGRVIPKTRLCTWSFLHASGLIWGGGMRLIEFYQQEEEWKGGSASLLIRESERREIIWRFYLKIRGEGCMCLVWTSLEIFKRECRTETIKVLRRTLTTEALWLRTKSENSYNLAILFNGVSTQHVKNL